MIKHIVVIGTSFSAGGGFEETNPTRSILSKYTNEQIPERMEDCAWPAFMSLSRIKIHNLAVPGSGIDYLIRMTKQWIKDHQSDIRETLFLFEVSGYGRLEFWSNEFNRYLVCNWDYGVRKENFYAALHTGTYWKDPIDLASKIEKDNYFIEEYLNKFHTPFQIIEDVQDRLFNFLCRLNHNGINFKLFGEQFYDVFIEKDELIQNNILKLYAADKEYRSISHFLTETKMQIKDITLGESNDFHGTLQANRIIGEQYASQLKAIYSL